MEKINSKEDMILKAYRENDGKGTIKIDIKSHTFGFELYRISLMLLDKIISWEYKDKKEKTKEDIDFAFEKIKNDYYNFYERHR